MTIRKMTPSGGSGGSGALGALGVLAATAVLGLVAGCSSGASSSSPSASVSPSSPSSSPSSAAASSPSAAPSSSSAAASSPAPSHSASAPASGGTGSGGSGGTGAAAGTPACATQGLKVSAGLAQGAAGSVYQVIDFTNISGAPCTLYGYPGVALAGGSPVTQVGQAASRSATSPATLVTLAAGATANALLRITQALNYPSSTCRPVATTYLQIYPPNQTTPVYLGYKSMGCSSTAVNLLSVSVVQAGSGG